MVLEICFAFFFLLQKSKRIYYQFIINFKMGSLSSKSHFYQPLPLKFSKAKLEQYFGEAAIALCPTEIPDIIYGEHQFHLVLESLNFHLVVWVHFCVSQSKKFCKQLHDKASTTSQFTFAVSNPEYRLQVSSHLWKQFCQPGSLECSRSRFFACYLAYVLVDWDFVARLHYDATKGSSAQDTLHRDALDFCRLYLEPILFDGGAVPPQFEMLLASQQPDYQQKLVSPSIQDPLTEFQFYRKNFMRKNKWQAITNHLIDSLNQIQ
jgi:hypothetical protein